MARSRRTVCLLAIVLVVACAARVGVGIWWQARLPAETDFYFGDSASYWALARAAAQGGPYEYGSPEMRVFRAPGLPLLLAPLFWPAGADAGPLWGRGIVALCGTAAVGCTFWLGRLLFGPRAGLLAAAVVALYPTNVFLGAMLLTEAPFAAAMLCQLACWTIAWQRQRDAEVTRRRGALGWAAAAGVAAGVATLIRPSWLLFTPFALAAACLASPARRDHWRLGVCSLAALAVTMLPWWVRNYAVTGSVVTTTLQVGAGLYDGWNPQATGASDMDFVPEFTAAALAEWEALPPAERGDFEVWLDRRFRRAAGEWARQNPARVLELAAIKFARMWNLWPNAEEFRALWMRGVVAATYLPLIVTAGLGLWRFRRQGRPIALCALPVVYLALLQMVFVGSIRYREPALMPLAVLAAGWLICRDRRNEGMESGGKDARHSPASD